MELRTIGSSDLDVSVFALGTMTFGDESDEAESHELLDRYYQAGGRFIDTADVYSEGVSEEIIGRWLARTGSRPELTIATKARFAIGEGPDNEGAGRAHLEKALDASLRRLGIEVIDLYQIHAWDPSTQLEETMAVLDEFVAAGKVRAIGVSNFLGWQLERALRIARYQGSAPVVSLQPQYSLLAREIELDVMPLCLEEGVGLLPWSPLAGGWLTGKYSPSERPSGGTRLGEDPTRGVEAYDLRNTARTWAVLDVVEGIATAHGVTQSQVALNWVRNRPGVTSVLLGCRTVSQLDDNLGALQWNLTDDDMRKLDEASAPGMPTYPQGFLESYAGYDVWERLTTRVDPVL